MVTLGTKVCCCNLQYKAGPLHEDLLDYPRFSTLPSWAGSMGGLFTARNLLRRHSPPYSRRQSRKQFVTKSTLDTGATSGESDGGPFGLGTTRLKRIIQAGQTEFLGRFNKGRKNFPAKIFLLLLGYYSANALATILGQTGDWDVLAAGILVAVIEGIGYLMYRMPPVLGERGKEIVVFINYFKSGFSFGLFVDAFKLGS